METRTPEYGDMPLDEFRRAGARAVEWAASYLGRPDDYPVLARVEPGAIKDALPDRAPTEGEPIDRIIDDFEKTILPGITHWNHPAFMAYFGITGSGPGILGELLCATLNVNAMLWQTSPAATELEERVLDWLRRLVGLPDGFEGVIMDTASVSTLCAVAAAREALSDLGIRNRGMAGRSDLPRLCVYTSEEAHSSVEKAAVVLGIGRENVRKIPVDHAFRMSVPELAEAISADRASGARPFCVVATVGTTSTTSIDPVPEIAEICRREDVWLHVDAAYAGSAAIVPEFRYVLDGCEAATSIVLNPHKWLFTPIDCSAFYTRRPDTLKAAFSLVPEYLRTRTGDGTTDFMDYGVQLGRRFRALKLWMVLRYFGSDGIARRLSRHVALAQELGHRIDEHPDFERTAPTPLSVVCFRAVPRRLGTATPSDRAGESSAGSPTIDRFNEALLDRVNASGAIYLSHTRIRGAYALRLAIGNIRTDDRHVQRGWELLQRECEILARDWSSQNSTGGREAEG